MSDPVFQGRPPAAVRPAVQAPNALRDRLGSRLGRIDPDAIARAEAALKGLSSQFGQWLEDEVRKLEAARTALREQGMSRPTVDQVYTHAHDLKGLGSTYEFPIITQLAGSLCRLLGEADKRLKAPLALIDVHVDAIRAAVRDDIKTTENPVGRGLVDALERQVDQHIAAV
jgi:chemotaxis protein histidine kinase CheA